MEGERPSDKYNVSSNGGGLMFGNGFTSGYGLGASAFGNSSGLASSEARGLGSMRPAADQQTAPTALPAQGFLIPYGGVDKYYPPPSPVKPSNVRITARLLHEIFVRSVAGPASAEQFCMVQTGEASAIS